MQPTFSSDNYAGALPEMLEAIAAANSGHAPSYGADDYTAAARQHIRDFFNAPQAEVFFVFNGTGANVLSLSATAASHQSVIVADVSHFYNDESSAPETFSGCRLFAVPANEDGKLTPEAVKPRLIRKGDVHYAQPALLSVTQSTEYGTVYTPEELKALGSLCRENEIFFHVDGSRFFNALASLDCTPAALTVDAGVDVLSLGGTKAGLLFGEAVVVFNPQLISIIRYKQKQVMQLASKTRFIAAQFSALLRNNCWRKNAAHANAMAGRLATALLEIPPVQITRPVQANVVFAILPKAWIAALQAQVPFYVWQEATSEVRLMCGWDMDEEVIRKFVDFARKLANQ